ncbi:unnamed protein product [Rotaria sordida]|uniref:Uncharacterized protein n=1 Tax=Rotaria sordida TaxID=392033 RepID=A0A814I5P1_9BILA|nr:unnamed protein product [Rotaria sordida]CAF0847773.1 unnamed protein product [Rotaria sordida]CAF1015718.1 unnamed protein product [Rotaria sordida]CAF1019310.1 unnamed protein product [Rotaria sordida]
MNDGMNCCSAYFYTRFTNDDTLIDLAMMNYPDIEKNENCSLSNDDQPLRNRLITFTTDHSFWFRIFFLIIVIIIIYLFITVYLYTYLFVQKVLDSHIDKPSS